MRYIKYLIVAYTSEWFRRRRHPKVIGIEKALTTPGDRWDWVEVLRRVSAAVWVSDWYAKLARSGDQKLVSLVADMEHLANNPDLIGVAIDPEDLIDTLVQYADEDGVLLR